jgi:hypothetical protein
MSCHRHVLRRCGDERLICHIEDQQQQVVGSSIPRAQIVGSNCSDLPLSLCGRPTLLVWTSIMRVR